MSSGSNEPGRGLNGCRGSPRNYENIARLMERSAATSRAQMQSILKRSRAITLTPRSHQGRAKRSLGLNVVSVLESPSRSAPECSVPSSFQLSPPASKELAPLARTSETCSEGNGTVAATRLFSGQPRHVKQHPRAAEPLKPSREFGGALSPYASQHREKAITEQKRNAEPGVPKSNGRLTMNLPKSLLKSNEKSLSDGKGRIWGGESAPSRKRKGEGEGEGEGEGDFRASDASSNPQRRRSGKKQSADEEIRNGEDHPRAGETRGASPKRKSPNRREFSPDDDHTDATPEEGRTPPSDPSTPPSPWDLDDEIPGSLSKDSFPTTKAPTKRPRQEIASMSLLPPSVVDMQIADAVDDGLRHSSVTKRKRMRRKSPCDQTPTEQHHAVSERAVLSEKHRRRKAEGTKRLRKIHEPSSSGDRKSTYQSAVPSSALGTENPMLEKFRGSNARAVSTSVNAASASNHEGTKFVSDAETLNERNENQRTIWSSEQSDGCNVDDAVQGVIRSRAQAPVNLSVESRFENGPRSAAISEQSDPQTHHRQEHCEVEEDTSEKPFLKGPEPVKSPITLVLSGLQSDVEDTNSWEKNESATKSVGMAESPVCNGVGKETVCVAEMTKQNRKKGSLKGRSRVGGGRRKGHSKSLDELSEDEDEHAANAGWVPGHKERATAIKVKQEAVLMSPESSSEAGSTSRPRPRRSLRHSRGVRNILSGAPEVIDLTNLDESEEDGNARKTPEKDDDGIDTALKALKQLRLESKSQNPLELPRCLYLKKLTDDEEELVRLLTQRTEANQKLVTIEAAKIPLYGSSFKRLRGTRWLDDELINAYVSLINTRHEAIFRYLNANEREGIPRTYVFNTYFYTRLSSGVAGFDYSGVAKWTTRARVDILKQDLILVPVNLGNHHWVLSGIDMKHREVFYWDSMHGADTAKVIPVLKRWVVEELRSKHSEEVARDLEVHKWENRMHQYRIWRVGALPEQLEPIDARAGRMAKVPRQTDGGSCGVFTAKMADCLSLGIKIYFKQKDIPLIRKRMAIDLFRGYVPL